MSYVTVRSVLGTRSTTRLRFPLGDASDCASDQHYNWETGACEAGLCPAGEVVEPSTGNCVPVGTDTSSQVRAGESASSSSAPSAASVWSGGDEGPEVPGTSPGTWMLIAGATALGLGLLYLAKR